MHYIAETINEEAIECQSITIYRGKALNLGCSPSTMLCQPIQKAQKSYTVSRIFLVAQQLYRPVFFSSLRPAPPTLTSTMPQKTATELQKSSSEVG